MDNLMIPEDIRKLSRQRAPVFYKIMKAPRPEQVEPGQVWSTHSFLDLPDGRRFEAIEARLVVILDGAGDSSEFLDQVTSAPISLSVNLASEYDLIVSGENSPLEFEFMVEVWNETPTLKGHLRQFLGKLSDEAIAAMRGLYTAQLLDEAIPEALKQWVGFRIMNEDDPRLAFQETEIKAVAYLAEAATVALTLEMVTQGSAESLTDLVKPYLRLELPLVFAKLPAFGPAVVFAAGKTQDEDAYIISYDGDEGQFTFELLVDRLPPYEVYVLAHQISAELKARTCVVTVLTAEGELQSVPSALEAGVEIQVGNDPNFTPREGDLINVAIA